MKKLFTLLVILLTTAAFSKAQEVLLFDQPYFDGGTAVTSAFDPGDELDYEAADNFFGIDEDIEEVVFYGLTLKYGLGGWAEQVPSSTEPFIMRFYEYQEGVSPGLFAPTTGTYEVVLMDAYGDGWAGDYPVSGTMFHTLSVYVNGVVVLSEITMADGAGPESFTFSANTGDEISTVFTINGDYADESYYAIIDPDDNLIAEDGGTMASPGDFTPTGILPAGEVVVLPPDWDNPVSTQFLTATVENVGTVWEGSYQLYKFTVELDSPMDMGNGWVSAQMNSGAGSGTWFLWINSLAGDLMSYSRAGDVTKDKAMASRASISFNNQSGAAKDLMSHDFALELWGTEEIIPEDYTLTVNIVGDGLVEVNDIVYTEPVVVEEGTVLTLEAIAGEGWEFVGWTGDVVSSNTIEEIVMNSDNTVTATFIEMEPEVFTLDISIVGDGIVEVNDVVYTEPLLIEEGTELVLEAIPATDWFFSGWTGDLVSGEEVVTITMDANKDIVATFTEEIVEPDFYTLTLTVVGEGVVEVNEVVYTEPITVEEGTVLNLEAIPALDWFFAGWSGDLISSDEMVNVTMDSDKNIVATFTEEIVEPDYYTLTITIIGNGIVEVDEILYTEPIVVEEGTVLNLEAIPDMDWMFAGWSGDLVSSMEIVAVTMDEDKNVIATFIEEEEDMYMLTLLANPPSGGEVAGGGMYQEGEMVTVAAAPNSGYYFVNWTCEGEVVSTDPVFTYTMPAMDVTLIANFEPAEGELDVTFEVTGVSCPGYDDGSIFVSVTGGQKPYNICIAYGCDEEKGTPDKWAQTAYYTGLVAGYWHIWIVDANGVAYEECVLVPEPEPLTSLVEIDPVLCYEEGVTTTAYITIMGGTPPYMYDGEIIEGNILMLPGLVAGEYAIEIFDACGSFITEFEVIFPLLLEADPVYEPILCYGGTTFVDVVATGGTGQLALYDIVDGEYVFVSNLPLAAPLELPAGIYGWVVMDENECIVPVDFELINPLLLEADPVYEPILCYGGTTFVDVVATGGTGQLALYDIVDGEYVFVSNLPLAAPLELPAGIYGWVVMDENECIVPVDFELINPLLLEADPVYEPILCYGGTTFVDVAATGGTGQLALYDIVDGEYVFVSNLPLAAPLELPAGIYGWVVMDENECIVPVDFELINPLLLEADPVYEPILCYGGTTFVDVVATGGTGQLALYDIVDGEYVFVSNLPLAAPLELYAGVYGWVVMDENECIVPIDFELINPLVLEAEVVYDPIMCYGGTTWVDVLATGGTGQLALYDVVDGEYVYVSDLPLAAPLELPAGPYSWVVMDENECVVPLEFILTQPDELMVEIEVSDVSCYGGDDGEISGYIVNGENGPYSICLFTSCDDDPLDCNNDAYKLQGFSYGGLVAGEYMIAIIDQYGCVWTECVTVGQPDPLYLELAVENLVCEGGEVSYVDDWVWFRQGLTRTGNMPNADRSDPDQVIGEPALEDIPGTFFTLGFGGEMIVKFENPFLNGPGYDLWMIETSYGWETCETYPEMAHVWVAQEIDESMYTPVQGEVDVLNMGDTWYYLGEYCLDSEIDLGELPWAQYVYIKDVSDPEDFYVAQDQDGYDINGLIALHGMMTVTADVVAYVEGGTPPYTYMWNTGSTASMLMGVGEGMYSVVVTDAHNCTIEGSIMVECDQVDPDPAIVDDQWQASESFFDISAYPNPFSQQATIEFTARESGYLTIEVYNILGERVATLFEGEAVANTLQKVIFDANNLQKGMYFFKFTSGNNTHLERMILAR